ncbi:MAG: DoxX family protein [Rhodospirillales bacterium]|nr:DoxX family protein [Rhodospirillales bacterium]
MHVDHSLIQTLAHVLVAICFIVIGIINFFRREDVHEEMRSFGVPMPEIALPIGLASQWLGSLLVLFDYYAGVGALILIGFTIVASFIFLRWWKIKDNPFRRVHMVVGIFTNFAVIAALLQIVEMNGLVR